jgi:hypothetical protein
MAVKTVIQAVFTDDGRPGLCNEERIFSKDTLISLTNEEFSDKVEECFHKMNNIDHMLSHAVAYKMDYSDSDRITEPVIHICLGNYIYSHIFTFYSETDTFKQDTIYQVYFEQIVNPFLSEIM